MKITKIIFAFCLAFFSVTSPALADCTPMTVNYIDSLGNSSNASMDSSCNVVVGGCSFDVAQLAGGEITSDNFSDYSGGLLFLDGSTCSPAIDSYIIDSFSSQSNALIYQLTDEQGATIIGYILASFGALVGLLVVISSTKFGIKFIKKLFPNAY